MKRFLLFFAVALLGVTPTLAQTVKNGDTLSKIAQHNQSDSLTYIPIYPQCSREQSKYSENNLSSQYVP